MSLNIDLLLIGIILILVDIFFASDLPTFTAILLFSIVFFNNMPFSILLNTIFTILFFFALLIIYITLWKKLENIVVNKYFAKDKYKAGVYGLKGQKATVKVVDGQSFASINGDLYPFYSNYQLKENDIFIIKDVKDGKIIPDI